MSELPDQRVSVSGPRLAAAAAWSAASLAALVVALAGLRIDTAGTAAAAAANGRSLVPFWIASASGWAALTCLWALLRRAPAAPRRAAASVAIIAGVAVAARIAVLAAHEPALSDDVYRYVFDGRNLARGVNPYTVTPQEAAADSALAARVNNPELHTIYLPVSQYVFGAAAPLAGDAGPAGAARVYRGVFVAFELAAIAIILLALRRAGRSPWWAALYAWHPLPLAEIAGSGHQDAVGVALLVGALYVAHRAAAPVWRWTVPLALAALVKPVVVPVAAFVLKGRRWSRWAASLAVGAAACGALAAPLLLVDGGAPLKNLDETVQRFRLKWAHFGGVYEPVLWTIERARPGWSNDRQEVLARRICIAGLAAVLGAAWWRARRRDAWACARLVLIAMVVFSPAAHPWYLLWALATVPLSFGAATWVASLTLPWGYAAWAHTGAGGAAEWGVPARLMYAAWVPVIAAAVAQAALSMTRVSRPPALAR